MVAFDTFSGVQPLRAVAYARFSSDNQREESITAQLRAIREYAEREGIAIVREYVDEARSGMTDDRPSFLQMISDLQHGLKVDYVLVHKLDRFARNRYDAVVYKREVLKAGARLIAVTQPLDDSPESVILEAMLEAMAEYYSKNLAREVMKGQRETALQAKFTGGMPPLGYDIDPVTHKYVINENEAQIVRLIFSMVRAGHPYGEVIRHLNGRGYRTKRGGLFGKNSLYSILTNERYVGSFVYNRTAPRLGGGPRNAHRQKSENEVIRIPNAIPPIISPDEWEEVQRILRARKQAPAGRRGTRAYILTGKAVCGVCGGAMVGSYTIGGGGKRYYRYVCSTAHRKRTCDNRAIRADELERYVLNEILRTLDRDNFDKLAERIEHRYLEMSREVNAERRRLQEQIQQLTQRLDNLFEALESGAMPASVVGPRITALTQERAALEEHLRQLEETHMPLSRPQILDYLEESYRTLTDRVDVTGCRRLVNVYVDKVVVDRDVVTVILRLPSSADNAGAGGANLTVCTRANREDFIGHPLPA